MQVYIDSPIILNGVCLRWKGYINLEKLDGVGGMKFDEDSSRVSSFKGVSDLKTLLDYSYHHRHVGRGVGQLPLQILADQKVPPGSGGAPHN